MIKFFSTTSSKSFYNIYSVCVYRMRRDDFRNSRLNLRLKTRAVKSDKLKRRVKAKPCLYISRLSTRAWSVYTGLCKLAKLRRVGTRERMTTTNVCRLAVSLKSLKTSLATALSLPHLSSCGFCISPFGPRAEQINLPRARQKIL